MGKVCLLGEMEYWINFGQEMQQLANFYVSHNEDGVRIILGYWEDEMPVGFSIIEHHGREAEILYIFLKPEKRTRGNGKYLLYDTESWCHSAGFLVIKIRITEGRKDFRHMRNLLEGSGYTLGGRIHLFRCSHRDYHFWQEYMGGHGNKMIQLLKQRGFEAVSFEKASEETIHSLIEAEQNHVFASGLNSLPIMQNQKGRFEPAASHLILKDKKPVAYCLVNRPDLKSLIFEQIKTAEKFINTGVIFFAFAMSMESMKNLSYERVSFAMYQDNGRAIALSDRLLQKLIRVKVIQWIYFKEKG